MDDKVGKEVKHVVITDNAEPGIPSVLTDGDACEITDLITKQPTKHRTVQLEKINEAQVMSASDQKKLAKREWKARNWTQSNAFQCMVGGVILSNAIALGLEVDHGEEWKDAFNVLQHLFTLIFVIEMLCRWKVEGLQSYFKETSSQMDFVLVVLGVVDVWILGPLSEAWGFRTLTVLRIVRLVRLIRVIRLFRIFKELAIIGSSFIAGGKTLFFGAIFVLIVVYVFGIAAVDRFGRATNPDCDDGSSAGRLLKPKARNEYGSTSSIESGNQSNAEGGCGDLYDFGTLGTQYTLFGSLDRAMLTLYTCVTDGCGQDIIYKMVYKTPEAIVYWCFFVFFTSIGLVNVLIGLFCENVFAQAAKNEKELSSLNRERRRQCLQDLKVIFQAMDTDASDTVTRVEFLSALESDKLVAQTLEDLDLQDHERLFDVLDVDGSGELDIDEFFNGALLLANANEPAKARDTIGTYLLAQAIAKRIYLLSNQVKEIFGRICAESESPMKDSKSKRINGQQKDMSKDTSFDWLRQEFRMLHESINGIGERQTRLEQSMNGIGERQIQLEHEFKTLRANIQGIPGERQPMSVMNMELVTPEGSIQRAFPSPRSLSPEPSAPPRLRPKSCPTPPPPSPSPYHTVEI